MFFRVHNYFNDAFHEIEDIFVSKLIVYYILVHASEDDANNSFKALRFLPIIMLFYYSQA